MACENSWIDPVRLRSLAQSTKWSDPGKEPASPPAVGVHTGPALMVAQRPPRPEPCASVDEASMEQIDALLAWTRRSWDATTVLLADADGRVLRRNGSVALVDEPQLLKRVASSLTMLESGAPTSPVGHLAFQVDDQFLAVSWHRTASTRYLLVVGCPGAPPLDLLGELPLALADALASADSPPASR